MRMLDLFCGRFGWGKAFALRGWKVVGVDQVAPGDVPQGCEFVQADVRQLSAHHGRIGVRAEIFGWLHSWGPFDFACASSPCEEFSVHGMKHFHPNPPYPTEGIELFNYTHNLLEQLGAPYIMENVRAAQQFVGNARHRCGSFCLWGNAVPTLLPAGITKGFRHREMFAHNRTDRTGASATIPSELAHCVAEYAERIVEAASNT